MSLIEHVDIAALPASFVWDYDRRRPRLGRLYEKSKVSQWNAATDVDWSIEVDPGVVHRRRAVRRRRLGRRRAA